MPIYSVACPVCGAASDIFRRLSEYEDLPTHCGVRVQRKICAPAVQADISPYVSPGSGKLISSRSQQREDLRATGSILNEPGLKQDIARWREERREKDFAPVAAGIDEAVRNLVTAGHIES